MTANPRIGEELNAALHATLAGDERVFLLGEDIADPYGGAFGVTRGLSTAFPHRVRSTPISEGAILGVACGLALCGNRVIVEVMFGDFITLAFDQLVNVATKSVSMYGHHVAMPVLVRCPVGGGRGYGPTHSQSLQKHFIGVPHLALYELSPLHHPGLILAELAARTEPAILFEHKSLYPLRRHRDGRVDDDLGFEPVGDGGNWVHVRPTGGDRPSAVLIAPGGTAQRAMTAAVRLRREDNVETHVLVPARLYPADIEAILPVVAAAEAVWVVEESTAGGTWGAEIATRLHLDARASLRQPVRLLHSADRTIPAAPHLERQMLVSADAIIAAVRDVLTVARMSHPAPAVPVPTVVGAGAPDRDPAHVPAAPDRPDPAAVAQFPDRGVVRVPTLNNNDDSYLLVEWLVADGSPVERDTPIAVVETSKAAEEITAGAGGVIGIDVPAGSECVPGAVIARIGAAVSRTDTAPAAATVTGATAMAATAALRPAGQTTPVSRAQRRVADVVVAAHREIPAAFTVARVGVDAALAYADMVGADGGYVGLTEMVVRAVADLRPDFPMLFGSALEGGLVRLVDGAHVAVTVDAGTGLFLPVIRYADQLDLDEIADVLVQLRLACLRGALREADLAGPNIAVSLNQEPDVLFVQPIIPPGLASIVSVTAVSEELVVTGDGAVGVRRVIGLGLAYDHRLVNGRMAEEFLAAVARPLAQPAHAFRQRSERDRGAAVEPV